MQKHKPISPPVEKAVAVLRLYICIANVKSQIYSASPIKVKAAHFLGFLGYCSFIFNIA